MRDHRLFLLSAHRISFKSSNTPREKTTRPASPTSNRCDAANYPCNIQRASEAGVPLPPDPG